MTLLITPLESPCNPMGCVYVCIHRHICVWTRAKSTFCHNGNFLQSVMSDTVVTKHVAIEHLRCGQCGGETELLLHFIIMKFK